MPNARARSTRHARIGRRQNCRKHSHHAVLDDTVFDFGGAAGERRPVEKASRDFSLEGTPTLGLDAPERIDVELRHGFDDLGVHPLAAAGDTNDFASGGDVDTGCVLAPGGSGVADELGRQCLVDAHHVENARALSGAGVQSEDGLEVGLGLGHVSAFPSRFAVAVPLFPHGQAATQSNVQVALAFF